MKVNKSSSYQARNSSRNSSPDGSAVGTSTDLVVTDPKLAALLGNPKTLRQLEPFLGRQRSIAEAARETGLKPNTMLAVVKRLVAAGLLSITKERKRAGRPIKLYRSTAERYFIPFEATSAENLEAAMAERDGYWETLLRKNVVRARQESIGTWGTRIYRDDRGRLQIQAAIRPDRNTTLLDHDAPAVLSSWRDAVYLDFEDAKTLQREMFELLLRYHQKKGAQRYILRLGMAPALSREAPD